MEKLPSEGWQFKSDKPLPAWNEHTRLLAFCRDDYSLTLQYAGKESGYEWDYAIDVVWPGRDACGRGPEK